MFFFFAERSPATKQGTSLALLSLVMRARVAHMLVLISLKGSSSRPLSVNSVLTLNSPLSEERSRSERALASSDPYTWPASMKAVRVFICWRTVAAPKRWPVLPEPQLGAERKKGMHSSEFLPKRGSCLGICLGDKKLAVSSQCVFVYVCVFGL